jgi:cbb3-type cytochrome oxidase maturation protein
VEILYLLIPLSVVLVAVIVVAFFWAIRSGQFDDLEGPAHRILLDDDDRPHRGRGYGDDGGDGDADDQDER